MILDLILTALFSKKIDLIKLLLFVPKTSSDRSSAILSVNKLLYLNPDFWRIKLNIFNSKVSGELALLFELKIIDSFSVTWDAEVNTIGESSSGTNDKEAIVTFNVNYTSDHTDINLKHIILTDSEVTGGLECPVSTGNYCTLSDSDTSGRVNDGTDPDIAVTVGSFKYKSGENLSDYVWNY